MGSTQHIPLRYSQQPKCHMPPPFENRENEGTPSKLLPSMRSTLCEFSVQLGSSSLSGVMVGSLMPVHTERLQVHPLPEQTRLSHLLSFRLASERLTSVVGMRRRALTDQLSDMRTSALIQQTHALECLRSLAKPKSSSNIVHQVSSRGAPRTRDANSWISFSRSLTLSVWAAPGAQAITPGGGGGGGAAAPGFSSSWKAPAATERVGVGLGWRQALTPGRSWGREPPPPPKPQPPRIPCPAAETPTNVQSVFLRHRALPKTNGYP